MHQADDLAFMFVKPPGMVDSNLFQGIRCAHNNEPVSVKQKGKQPIEFFLILIFTAIESLRPVERRSAPDNNLP